MTMAEPQCITIAGDCRAVLPTLPAKRFRACVTSVPYWMQREYLPEEHPQKHLEIGREQTPREYVQALVHVFEQVRRVLTDDGTLWINIGDKFVLESGQTPGGGGIHERLLKKGAIPKRTGQSTPGLRPKNLMGLPWRLAFALQDDGWFLRMDNIWHKPNALPSSAKDRPTLAHEYVFLFSKKSTYFYNQDAVREPYATPDRAGKPVSKTSFKGQRAMREGGRVTAHDYDKGGRNMRSVWHIAAGGGGRDNGDHVAPMPEALARRCVLAGSEFGDHVLDPFGGQGTVARVANAEGRRATVIDLDERSVKLASDRTIQQGLCPNTL